jgi:hypothetical protein
MTDALFLLFLSGVCFTYALKGFHTKQSKKSKGAKFDFASYVLILASLRKQKINKRILLYKDT